MPAQCTWLLLAAAASTCLGACREVEQHAPPTNAPFPGYDLTHPSATFELPKRLKEISALTELDAHTVACVQDERGVVFAIDLRDGSVTEQLRFGAAGDYEGLTRVGETLWVLRGDGVLLEVQPDGEALSERRRVTLDLGHAEYEGLGYDEIDRVILIAPKSAPKGDRCERDARRIYRFDPTSGERRDPPALDTSIERIVADAARAAIPLPTRTDKKGREQVQLEVRFSSIAVHPTTGHYYALSAADRALFAFDRAGTLFAAHFWNKQELPQPEGITFVPGGDLVVTSEGVDGPARLLVYRQTGR